MSEKILAVFDLDYTLWPMNADQDVRPKLRKITDGVVDGRGREVRLYPEVKQSLTYLAEQGISFLSQNFKPTKKKLYKLL